MSTSPESDLDLEKLFLPDWAKESPQVNRYAKYEGQPGGREDRRQDSRNRPPRRPDGFPPRGPGAPQGRSPGDRSRSPRPAGPSGPGRPMRRPGGRDDRDRDRRSDERPIPIEPLPEIQVTFTPEEAAVDLLTKQIRMTGRAFPLFDIAQLILAKPDRHLVTVSIKKKPDGTPLQPLFVCAMDDTLWLSEDDAVRHVVDKHFTSFYQPDRIKIDPPKGVYTFVAQCGMSGVILGPPNYHDYQNQLRKLHAERFGRMPFDAFKARVKIVKDEEVVKKWCEDQSWKTEYVCLNLPEPARLNSREEVEKHFRQAHAANIIKPIETHRLTAAGARVLRDRNLLRLLRQRGEEQRRFPLQLATVLSQQFASRGLQFFKVNKTVTHVSVARPHYLDLESTPVSDGVRRIVEYINAKPRCTPRQLIETLAPRPAAPPTPATPASAAPGPAEPATPSSVPDGTAAAKPPTPAPPPPAGGHAEPTPEMAVILTDLHWLIHQGHVIEFANGALETAKKPVVKPPAPPKSTVPATRPAPSIAPVEPMTPPNPEAAAASDTGMKNTAEPPAATAATEETGAAPLPSASVTEPGPVPEPMPPPAP